MNRSIKKITLFFLGIGILALSVQGAYAQALDFFSNTQSLDLRSSGSDGAPGFNPCAGGNHREQHDMHRRSGRFRAPLGSA
ncbi:MAG: hypothetical protein MPW16_00905 [Candidatus Manganitrophus sp.]|nr:MAG: hypothetical protein MPW16_00905 [Candidatus Manganitrophus sp.]